MAFGAGVVAATLLSLTPLEQSQAQLLLTVNPLQGDTNRTVWTFTGSSSPFSAGTIPTATAGSTGTENTGFLSPFAGNTNSLGLPSGTQLFTAIAPSRYATAGYHSLTANPNPDWQPQITFQSATSTNTRSISDIYFFNNPSIDYVGIRVAGSSALSYSASDNVSWSGQGTMSYPIGDFTLTPSGEYFYTYNVGPNFVAAGTLGTPSSGGLRLVVSSTPRTLVPEPEEYALIFGLFALGFVLFRRHFQKKQRQPASPTL